MRYSHFLYTISLILFLSSCTKDADYSNYNLLIEKSWMLVKAEDENGEITEDCEKDNVFIFNSNNTVDIDYGNTTCDVDYSGYDAEWTFKNRGNTIRITYWNRNGANSIFLHQFWKIERLNENELILNYDGKANEHLRKTFTAI